MLLNGDVLLGVREENIGTLLFLRDDADRIIGFEQYSVSGSLSGTYYYEFNAQGDVVALYDENKAIIAKYSYNSWGKLLSVTNANGNSITASGHVANLNPIRYRGYYYDVETGFYYLNSRYYDPNTCRFINADEYASTGQGIIGFNMYAYCLNNPVIYYDPNGTCVLLSDGSILDCGTICSVKNLDGSFLTQNQVQELHNEDNLNSLISMSRKKSGDYQRKDKKKGSENRQPTGARERNVGHKNGEEHSRVPKGGKKVHIEQEWQISSDDVKTAAEVVTVVAVAWFVVKWSVAIATAAPTGGTSIAVAAVVM